ncbi:MAG: glycosyltransferase, partial [Candidatus Lokiarchaeota archaeon]|nr:glycosyltransferase [Candidatus Lokiarchaeota archaeon]
MESFRIIGIMLIKDEDLYIERVIQNVINFCDELIIAENYSQDRTYKIVSDLARQYRKISLHRIKDLQTSHQLIENFVGSKTWIFRVDGDEIFDPSGLEVLRRKLYDGAFQDQWGVYGNMLHCTHLDPSRNIAKGYLAPPARTGMTLFNFSIIKSWVNCFQRLHSGTITFKEGYHHDLRYHLEYELSWEESYLRCLHTVF